MDRAEAAGLVRALANSVADLRTSARRVTANPTVENMETDDIALERFGAALLKVQEALGLDPPQYADIPPGPES